MNAIQDEGDSAGNKFSIDERDEANYDDGYMNKRNSKHSRQFESANVNLKLMKYHPSHTSQQNEQVRLSHG